MSEVQRIGPRRGPWKHKKKEKERKEKGKGEDQCQSAMHWLTSLPQTQEVLVLEFVLLLLELLLLVVLLVLMLLLVVVQMLAVLVMLLQVVALPMLEWSLQSYSIWSRMLACLPIVSLVI